MKALHHSEVVGAHLHWASIGVSPVLLEEVRVGQEVLLYQEVVAEVVMVYLY
jgi:hypothetical protein